MERELRYILHEISQTSKEKKPIIYPTQIKLNF